MTHIELDGYIADGKGGSEKRRMSLNFNAQYLGPDEQGFHLRLTEAGGRPSQMREMGVFLTPKQWRELIASLSGQIAVLEEIRTTLENQ